MTSSLSFKIIEKLFKIKDYYFDDIAEKNNSIVITLKRHEHFCSKCGSNKVRRHSGIVQKKYIGSINSQAIYGLLEVQKLICRSCSVILTESTGISEGKKQYSKEVGKTVLQYTCFLDNKSTGKLLGLSQSTIYRIDRSELEKLLPSYKSKIPQLTNISVDETAYKRRHNYATILTNYEDSKVIWMEKDRKKSSLEDAYKYLGSKLDTVKAISMDFWKAYETATIKYMPNVLRIYDKFHLSRILNRKIEEERREYQNSLPPDKVKNIKKIGRWIILKRQFNNKKISLESMKIENKKLYELYLIKEQFLSIFDDKFKSPEQALEEIIYWVEEVNNSTFSKLKVFSKNLIKRVNNILNWFRKPISNSKAEGRNNVIKSLLKRAYGYKDFEYFRLKVLQTSGYLMS